MQYRSKTYQIQGVAPLLMHNSRLADPFNEITKEIKKLTKKRDKTDADLAEVSRMEWYGGLYLQDGLPCIPGELIEGMLYEAGKKKRKGKDVRAGVICEQNFPLEYDGPQDLDQLWEEGNHRFLASVVVSGKRIMRTRPIFRQWRATIEVTFIDTVLNQRDIDEFVKMAAQFIGLGDWRPRFGRFEVVK